MRFLYPLILVLVLAAQYSVGYYRGASQATAARENARAAIEGWTQCLVDLRHSNDTAKEAIELAKSYKR